VQMARRGWLTAGDVLNTLPLSGFASAIQDARSERLRGA